jgi:uracil-DNA glycosylase family 4
MSATDLAALAAEVAACRACARLVAWREQVARERVARFATETYWARPVPGFGDASARIVVVGLAPAAHGANRTGRMFTGDRSGDWLFRALHRVGLANQPSASHGHDGLVLHDVYITAAVRCAPPGNRPDREERARCRPFLIRELALLERWQVAVVLGGLAFDTLRRQLLTSASPQRFGHGVELELPNGRRLLASFHPSQQNTFTGKLTEAMFDAIWARAVELVDRQQR